MGTFNIITLFSRDLAASIGPHVGPSVKKISKKFQIFLKKLNFGSVVVVVVVAVSYTHLTLPTKRIV